MNGKTITGTFTCPNCMHELDLRSHAYRCSHCERKWQVMESGIANFATQDFWWNHLSPEEMLTLCEIAEEKGWQIALQTELLPRTSEYVYRYASSESRADWHFLLGLKPNAKVLDIGCGWGASLMMLARHYSEAYGIDTNPLNLRFVKARAQQEHLDNVVLARTDALESNRLPFNDGYFDAVILNGVLEWVGSAITGETPDDSQRRALAEVHRVLKTGGKLYVGIENRYGFGNFLGGKAHNGVPFADILPRKMADWLSKRFGHQEGFRTYTHSLWGYQKLFADCGFSPNRIYFPYPDYRFPKVIIPLSNNTSMLKWANTNMAGVKRIILTMAIKLHVFTPLVYSYSIVLEK